MTHDTMLEALKDLGLTFQTDGTHFVSSNPGRFAPAINTIITLDEDGTGAMIMTALTGEIPAPKRSAVCELLNLVHGQNLWNVRFHLDDTGRVFAISKLMLWGKPFNGTQLGDLIFTALVTTDRLFPCLQAVDQGSRVEEAFEKFFSKVGDTSS
jgi:hypothetical protein